MIGVDRLDYSKGLAARFKAYSHCSKPPQGRAVEPSSFKSHRHRAPKFRNIRKFARPSQRRPVKSTAAMGNLTGRTCGISTRASATRY
jgi:hypothetical protein